MSGDTAAQRKAAAEAEKAEADARTARASAEKAERENREWESAEAKEAREAERQRVLAEAAEKKRKAEQTLGDALAMQKLEAESRKASAEADKSTADAQRAQVSALIPDFSKIDKGETTLKGDAPVLGSLLTPLALDQAAKKLVGDLRVSKEDRLLITTDADLASTDAVYLEVVTGLDTLTVSAEDLLKATNEDSSGRNDARRGGVAIAGAIASAIPGLVSLFSANRTISSASLTADTSAAVAAVASQLREKATVRIDSFSLVDGGEVAGKEKNLRGVRSELAKRKLELEPPKAKDGNEEPPSVAAGIIGQLITQIDAFLTSLHASGGKRSPFAIAALRQQLHPNDAGGQTFNRVLFLEASAGTANQLVNDRPFWFKDKIQVIGSAAIVYWLIDTATSNIVASGVARGTVQMSGKIGDKLEFGKPSSLDVS